jgi:NAD+ kinase
MRVGLLLKRDKPEAVQLALELSAHLESRGHEPFLVGTQVPVPGIAVMPEGEAGARLNLLVVLGGDGTLLRGSALVADYGVPILGVNLGHLGFLTAIAPTDARDALDRALAGELPTEERMRLRCELHDEAGTVRVVRAAANDVVVSQGALARLIELDVRLVRDGEETLIAHYRADGLIVATPTGSTAYNLAAGGPIVTPAVQAMVVTPICSHALTNRPVVAPATSRLRVRLAQPAEAVNVTIDGQWGTTLDAADVVEICVSPRPLVLFRTSESYFDVLRRKLRWG